ncbi:TatD family hydrolase [bacterium]
MIIDTHVHFSLSQFDNDREQAVERARNANVKKFIEVGFDLDCSQKSIKLASKTQGMYASVGIHPHHAEMAQKNDILDKLKNLAKNEKVCAWGEIGLDYYRNLCPQDLQVQGFKNQIECAYELNLPIIVHCRDAQDDLKKIFKEYSRKFTGVIHSFSGDTLDAEFYIHLGFILGIGCPVTYPKNAQLKKVVKDIPINKIILETDAPYLPPQPYRGRRNESAYLTYVVKEIAQLKQLPLQTVEDITTQTAVKLFNIKD